jgi:hypothetical protein
MQNGGNNMEINIRLDKIEQTLERLEAALVGDKFNGQGYKGRLENVEARLSKLENSAAAKLWVFFGAGGIGGAVIVKIIEYFLSK